jgi:uncharacterized membrane protein YphA (DoxX/SURF4 family)
MECKKKQTWAGVICALLIFLFVYTGIYKILDYTNFKVQLGRSPFIDKMNGFIAPVLPAGELLISLLLMIKRTRLAALYLSFALMTAFTGYIWLMLNYAPDLPCSCGGIISAMTWHDHLVFNACFTGLTIIGAILQGKINYETKCLPGKH